MKHGFIKVASAVPATRVADCKYNVQQIESLIVQSEGKGVEVIVFPNFVLRVIHARTCLRDRCCWMKQKMPYCSCLILPVN